MDIALWVIAALLALVFVAAGAMKLLTPHAKLVENPNMGWAKDFSPATVKLIGLVEIAGAAGLILPPLVGIAEWLTPLAAAGLTLDMVGAFATHARRKDPVPTLVTTLVLGALAAFVAIGRYWIQPF